MSEEQNINVELEDVGTALDDLNKAIESREFRPRQEGAREGSRPEGSREGNRDGARPGNRNFRPNMGGKKKSFFAKKVCKFTTNQIDPATIDYKNLELLKRFVMPSGKIVPRRITGTSSKYQRILAKEIKKARIIGLLPFSAR